MSVATFVDPSSNLHPFECDGKGACIHCDETLTYRGEAKAYRHPMAVIETATWEVDHDSATCELCVPAFVCDVDENGGQA